MGFEFQLYCECAYLLRTGRPVTLVAISSEGEALGELYLIGLHSDWPRLRRAAKALVAHHAAVDMISYETRA